MIRIIRQDFGDLTELIAQTDALWQEWARQNAPQGQPFTRAALLRTWAGSPYYHQAARQIGRAAHAGLPYTLTADQWGQTLAYFGGACAYCGTWHELQTLEHWHAHKNGGGFVADNIIPACLRCNQSRRDRNPWLWAIHGAGKGKVKDGALVRIDQWAEAARGRPLVSGISSSTAQEPRGNHAHELCP